MPCMAKKGDGTPLNLRVRPDLFQEFDAAVADIASRGADADRNEVVRSMMLAFVQADTEKRLDWVDAFKLYGQAKARATLGHPVRLGEMGSAEDADQMVDASLADARRAGKGKPPKGKGGR